MATATTPTGPHCELCGDANPASGEGYTECCNELVCYDGHTHTWVSENGAKVQACCGFVAGEKFETAGHGDDGFWRDR